MKNTNLGYIATALKGAKYHEDKAFQIANTPDYDYNKIVFHLRAYFWELWSVWDYILQETNQQTLKYDPYNVRRDFLISVRKEMPKYQHLGLLESILGNERLIRIMLLRDHAHKWQIEPYLIERNDDGVTVIALHNLDSKDKNLPGQINIDRNDLFFMKNFVESLSREGFFK